MTGLQPQVEVLLLQPPDPGGEVPHGGAGAGAGQGEVGAGEGGHRVRPASLPCHQAGRLRGRGVGVVHLS